MSENEEKPDGGNGDQEPEPANNQPQGKPFKLIIDGVLTTQGIVVRSVNGFDKNYDQTAALMINFEGMITQVRHLINRNFVQRGQAGGLDETLTIQEKKIIVPGNGIKVPVIVPPSGITKH